MDFEIIGRVILADPVKLKGFCITGVPSDESYKELIGPLKESLSKVEYAFASIIQLFKPGVIENTYATLGIAFDEAIAVDKNHINKLTGEILELINPVLEKSEMNINLVILNRKSGFLNNFKDPSSWIIEIKNEEIFNERSSWWKFW